MRDGIVLEMGGLDGKISSQSRVFEKVGWKRIVLEGNPQFRDALSQLSSAVTVAATVCEERQPTSSTRRPHVHFVTDNKDNFTSGRVQCACDMSLHIHIL